MQTDSQYLYDLVEEVTSYQILLTCYMHDLMVDLLGFEPRLCRL